MTTTANCCHEILEHLPKPIMMEFIVMLKGLQISEVVMTDAAFSDHHCVFFLTNNRRIKVDQSEGKQCYIIQLGFSLPLSQAIQQEDHHSSCLVGLLVSPCVPIQADLTDIVSWGLAGEARLVLRMPFGVMFSVVLQPFWLSLQFCQHSTVWLQFLTG